AGRGETLPRPPTQTAAGGTTLPRARAAAEARRAGAACGSPPLGRRGFGPRRMSSYGRQGGVESMRTADALLLVSVQIETQEALAEIGEIVTIPGLDGVVVGPYDLSCSMGKPSELTDPEIRAATRRIEGAARPAGL